MPWVTAGRMRSRVAVLAMGCADGPRIWHRAGVRPRRRRQVFTEAGATLTRACGRIRCGAARAHVCVALPRGQTRVAARPLLAGVLWQTEIVRDGAAAVHVLITWQGKHLFQGTPGRPPPGCVHALCMRRTRGCVWRSPDSRRRMGRPRRAAPENGTRMLCMRAAVF